MMIVEGTNDSGGWLRADVSDFDRSFLLLPDGTLMELETVKPQPKRSGYCIVMPDDLSIREATDANWKEANEQRRKQKDDGHNSRTDASENE